MQLITIEFIDAIGATACSVVIAAVDEMEACEKALELMDFMTEVVVDFRIIRPNNE